MPGDSNQQVPINSESVPVSQSVPVVRGMNLLKEEGSILNILKNDGFIERLKQQLLGQVYDRANKRYKPLCLRIMERTDNVRIDHVEVINLIKCGGCEAESNQGIIICDKITCGLVLDKDFMCSKHGLVNNPRFRCNSCRSTNTKIIQKTINYHNDAASMNQQGAHELIGLFLMIFSDMSKIGSQKEHFKLKEQKHLLMEIGWLIDSNWRRYEITESNIEAIKAVIFKLANSMFNLIVSGDPKSLIEYLTQLRHESVSTINQASAQKSNRRILG